jgi:hypothetical protein
LAALADESKWDSSRHFGHGSTAKWPTYIGDNTARLASVLEPAIVTLATVYVMAWGYLQPHRQNRGTGSRRLEAHLCCWR